MKLKNNVETREFTAVAPGQTYYLPVYKLDDGLVKVEGERQVIKFVKGTGQEGIITESLLSMLITHLKTLNSGHLSNRQTAIAITKLQEALMWLEDRKVERIDRGVFGTNNA